MDHKTASKLAKDMIRRWHTTGDRVDKMHMTACEVLGHRRVSEYDLIKALSQGDYIIREEEYDFLAGYTRLMILFGAEGFTDDGGLS